MLQGCSEADLDHGFTEFFKSGETFFPKPGQIRELILIWRADKRQHDQEQWTQDYLAENRKARESGKTVSYGEIIKTLKDTVAKMPDITPDRKKVLGVGSVKLSTSKPTEDAPKVGTVQGESGK